jgi:hypothetical protein
MRWQIRGLSVVGLLFCTIFLILGILTPLHQSHADSRLANVTFSLGKNFLGDVLFLLAWFSAPVAGITSCEYAWRS